MDANKLKVLKDNGYVINKACGLCKHMDMPNVKAGFGTCNIKTYEHLKHVGAPRQLSVHEHGVCESDFEMREGVKSLLEVQHWGEFIDKRENTRSNMGKKLNKKVRY